MNARTALMQAVEAYGTTEPERVLFIASEYLEWLRKNVPAAQQSVPQSPLAAGQGTGVDTTAPTPVPTPSPVTAGGDSEEAAGEGSYGEGETTPAAPRKSRAKPKDDNGSGWEYRPGDGHECEWIEAPRKGFVMCKWCGEARRAG